MPPCLLLVALASALAVAAPGTASAQDPCGSAKALLAEHDLAEARDVLMGVAGPDDGCVRRNLATINRELATEKKLCAQGAVLAKSGKDEAAQRAYVRALEVNVASTCAKKGLAEPKGWFETTNGSLTEPTKLAITAGKILLTTLGIAILLFFFRAARRRSLVVGDLSDGASKVKVGTAVTALIQKRLIGLGEDSQRGSEYAYDMDVVAADVELLAREDELSSAVAGLADSPQLGFLASVLSLADRIANRRLTAGGELLLPGQQGVGVALALLQRNSVQARDILWADEVKTWFMAADVPSPNSPSDDDPTPYYGLAVPAAAWIQFAVALHVGNVVAKITRKPASFTLLGVALELERKGEIEPALKAYGKALELDADNVAALINAGLILARYYGLLGPAVNMIEHAVAVLERRYEEPE